MAVTITATPDSVAAKVTVVIDMGLGTVTAIKVERKSYGKPWETLRAGAVYAAVAGKATFVDYEVPFDLPVYYRATQVTPAGSLTGTSATVTMASVGYTWLKDPAYPTRNMRLDEVTSLVEQSYTSRAGVFAVIDRARPVVVAARRASWAGELALTTATDAQRVQMEDLLSRGQILLLTTPANYGLGAIYVHVGDVTQTRPSGIVTDPTRSWKLPLTSVDRPSAALSVMPVGMRWADVKVKYATWQALTDSDLTWNQLLESTP